MGYTNQDIAFAAQRGLTRRSATGNFWTENVENYQYGFGYYGWNSDRIIRILRDRAAHITQIVGSYGTIVAWKDSGQWVRVDRSYSITTSSKHLSTLYFLSEVFIPGDCGLEEYTRILAGKMEYTRGYGHKLGTYRPGKAFAAA